MVLLQGPDYGNRTAILEQFRREAEAHIVTNDVVISLGCTDYRPGEDRSLRELFDTNFSLKINHPAVAFPPWLRCRPLTCRQQACGLPKQIEEVDPSCQIVI